MNRMATLICDNSHDNDLYSILEVCDLSAFSGTNMVPSNGSPLSLKKCCLVQYISFYNVYLYKLA